MLARAGSVTRVALTLATVLAAFGYGISLACVQHDECFYDIYLRERWFCNTVPFGRSDGTCEACWKCCLHLEEMNFTAMPDVAVAGGCAMRCGCNTGAFCESGSDCALGLFCKRTGNEPSVCQPCDSCDTDADAVDAEGCSAACPAGPLGPLLRLQAANSSGVGTSAAPWLLAPGDSALRKAVTHLSFALEPGRDDLSDRATVTPQELSRLLGSELEAVERRDGPASHTATLIYEAVQSMTAAAQLEIGDPLPLAAVAAALSFRGSRAMLCPKIDASQPASAMARVTGPGCPCNYTAGAAFNRCPAGSICSRQDFLGLSTDLLRDPAWWQLRAVCVSCDLGQYCEEGLTTTEAYGPSDARTLDCPNGYYCPSPGEAILCPAGNYCPPRATNYTTCDVIELLQTPQTFLPPGDDADTLIARIKALEPLRGNYCPPGSTRPGVACRGGYYCPNTSTQLICPAGHYCKQQSIHPVKCPPLVRCPEGTEAPDGRPLAGLIFGLVVGSMLGSLLLTELFFYFNEHVASRWSCFERFNSPQDAAASFRLFSPRSRLRAEVADWLGLVKPTSFRAHLRHPWIDFALRCYRRVKQRAEGAQEGAASPGQQLPSVHGAVAQAAESQRQRIGAGPAVSRSPGTASGGTLWQSWKSRMRESFGRAERAVGGKPQGSAAAEGGLNNGVVSIQLEAVGRGPPTGAASGKFDMQATMEQRYWQLEYKNNVRFSRVKVLRPDDGDQADADAHHEEGVSGIFEAGQTTAIMGPSGGGKTLLIKVLSGRMRAPVAVLNESGLPVVLTETKYRRKLGYVPQDDILHKNLTVKENIAFSAFLKLPFDSCGSRGALYHIVDDTLHMLDIHDRKDHLVGSVDNPSISGGERKRVSIGVEIVGKPPVLFLDEPTSGLDATRSADLVSLLSQLAASSLLNIVAVVHQPRYASFVRFDKVLLLAKGGRAVFQGPPKLAVPYFKILGFRFLPAENHADTLLDIVANPIMHSSKNVRLHHLPYIWSSHGERWLASWLTHYRHKYDRGRAQEGEQQGRGGRTLFAQGSPPAQGGGFRRPPPLVIPDEDKGGDGGTAGNDGAAPPRARARAVLPAAGRHRPSRLSGLSQDREVHAGRQAASHIPADTGHPEDRPASRVFSRSDSGKRRRRTKLNYQGAINLMLQDLETYEKLEQAERTAADDEGRPHLSYEELFWQLEDWFPTHEPHDTGWPELDSPSSELPNPSHNHRASNGLEQRLMQLRLQQRMVFTDVPQLEDRGPAGGIQEQPSGSGRSAESDADLFRLPLSRPPGRQGDAAVRRRESAHAAVDEPELRNHGVILLLRHDDKGDGGLAPLHRAPSSWLASHLRGWAGFWKSAQENVKWLGVQACGLLLRNMLVSLRSFRFGTVIDTTLLLSAAFIVGVVQGSNWGLSSVPSNASMTYLVLSVLSSIVHLRTFTAYRDLQAHERMAGVTALSSFLSCNLWDLVWIAVSPAVYLSVYYYVVLPSAPFLDYYAIGFLVCFCSSGISYVISFSPIPPQEQFITTVLFTLILGAFLHGLSPSISSARGGFLEVVLGFSHNRWAMEAATIQEFKHYLENKANEAVVIMNAIGICRMDAIPVGDGSGKVGSHELLYFMSLHKSFGSHSCDKYYYQATWVLWGIGFGVRLLAFALLYVQTHSERFVVIWERIWGQDKSTAVMKIMSKRRQQRRWIRSSMEVLSWISNTIHGLGSSTLDPAGSPKERVKSEIAPSPNLRKSHTVARQASLPMDVEGRAGMV